MFAGCTSLSTVPNDLLPATELAKQCYAGMFHNCSNLLIAPELPAMTLVDNCYASMFLSCSYLTSIKLSATTLAPLCYQQMFLGCTSLSSIEVNFTNWNASSNATRYWVREVAESGIFTKPSGLPYNYGISYIPSNKWTVINK